MELDFEMQPQAVAEALQFVTRLETGPARTFFFRPALSDETPEQYADALGSHIADCFEMGVR